jgi:hypothetical protein
MKYLGCYVQAGEGASRIHVPSKIIVCPCDFTVDESHAYYEVLWLSEEKSCLD